MRCGNCLHAHADHVDGRCVNRTDRLHVATGVSVVTVCGCKRYVDEVKPSAVVTAVTSEPVPESEDEGEAGAAELDEEGIVAEPPPSRTRRRTGG